jgi:hypothetical protein
MILNYRYYRKTGIFDYLLISAYFFNWAIVNSFYMIYFGFNLPFFKTESIAGIYPIIDLIFGNILQYYQLTLDALPLFIVAIRAKYGNSIKEIPNLIKVLALTIIAMGILAIIDQNQALINPNLPLSDFLRVALVFNRGFIHAFVIYAFLRSQFQETSRSKTSRRFWILSSSSWVLSIAIVGSVLFILQTNFLDVVILVAFFIPLDIGYALILFNHIFYPESVLFTNAQLGRALKVYDRIEKESKKNPSRSINYIKNYLDSIPEEVIDTMRDHIAIAQEHRQDDRNN